jgi:hypothetical protein
LAKPIFKHSIAHSLPRRAKRLKFWKEQLLWENLDETTSEHLSDLFATYNLLLSRLASPYDRNPSEAETKAQEIEQEISQLFDNQRLLTSSIGRAAIRE